MEKNKLQAAVTTKIMDYSLDFVEVTDPMDDALRRDFACNALFYNIATKKIEDFTQHGMFDLHNRIINTPVDAEITFRNDPLRMIRAIRFAAKFGFVIHEDVQRVFCNEEVVLLLRNISRNRL